MKPIVLIPARMASTRLPGKPLADIAGIPMIVRVWRQAIAAEIGPVVVAAAEREIAAAIEAVGGRAVLTPPELPSGSDRIFAALERVDRAGDHDVIVNLQGDLPDLDPAYIRKVIEPLSTPAVDIATLVVEIDNDADRADPNVVKPAVVWSADGRSGRALYFSRATIPSGEGAVFHHLGIYAYRRAALTRFVALPPSPLEKREKLEQLRALEAGMHVAVVRVDSVPLSVDTADDLAKARAKLGKRASS
jgi:3-deoxy-manno-octulosonate cytidylyltransferase (CMP-KDO synthetase)